MFNISKIVPRITKRARVSGVAGITLSIIALLTYTIYAQSSGTPSQLRVKTDANNYLILTGLAQTAPISSPTVFTNTRLRTDSNGYLEVVLAGGTISPTTITCNSSIGTTSSVLIGGTPCSWSTSPLIGTSVSSPIIAGYSSVTHDSIYFLNTNTYWQNGRYNSTNLGAELFGLTKSVGNPGISIETFMNSGGTRKATVPMIQFTTYYNSSAGSLGDVWGQLYGWFNFSDEAKAVIWCSTDQTNCTSAVGVGSLKYIYEFSNDSNSLFKTSQITVMNSKSIIFNTDNAGDIGAVGATRPRTGYFGTSIISPLLTTAKINPTADSTTAISVANATGTALFVFDTTNGRLAIGQATAPGNLIKGAFAANTADGIIISNATSGTAANTKIGLAADNGSTNVTINTLSSSYTTSGRFVAGHGLLDTGYLDLSSSGANPIDHWSNGSKIISFLSAGHIKQIATGAYIEQTEGTAPAAPAANDARIYTQDNGAGKTQVCAIFSSGAAQCFATQP